MSAFQDTTVRVSSTVRDVIDPLWQFELAALATEDGAENRSRANAAVNIIAQIIAFKIAFVTLLALIWRFGGTSPRRAASALKNAKTVAAIHAEDTTRTRHLRRALARHWATQSHPKFPVLLLGRPSSRIAHAIKQLDPHAELASVTAFRPLSLGSYLRATPAIIGQMFAGIKHTRNYNRSIAFRDRIAIAYRMAQGAVHAVWWARAAQEAAIDYGLFGHTGIADTSQLEQAMQALGTRTVHIVHGTNIGWPFAGLSNVAIFPSGADAKLGSSLPSYGHCTQLPLSRPAASNGNGKWALLTSYTHLSHPAYATMGSALDIELVELVREAAAKRGQNPQDIFWRPHPQINLVDLCEKRKLEQAITGAGFTPWPESWPYERLGEFSAVVTSPSTVLTDALRLGQPAIVASLSPLQSDLLYSAHPLLVHDTGQLHGALRQVLDPSGRSKVFEQAWDAIEPGAALSIEAIKTAADQSDLLTAQQTEPK